MNNENTPIPPQQPMPQQPFNSQSAPQPMPQLAPQPAPQPTGIFTGGLAPTESAKIEAPKSNNTSKKILSILLVAIIVFAIGAAGFFLIPKLFSTKKSIAEFEQIISKLGYSEAPIEIPKTDDGEISVYMKGTGAKVEAIAMFFEAPTKNSLKDRLEQSASSLGIKSSSVDFSKDYNKELSCYTAQKNYICVGVVIKENTLLFSMYNSTSSEDKAKSEIEKVIKAMDYQE